MKIPQKIKGIEKGTNEIQRKGTGPGNDPVLPAAFAQPRNVVGAGDLHAEPMAAGAKGPNLPDEELNRIKAEKLADMEKKIGEKFSGPEKEFVDSAIENYLKRFLFAKTKTEEAGKPADDQWIFKFRQKYIKDRVRLGSEKKRGGSSGLLDPEKAKLFKEYIELKLPEGIPPEKPEVDKGGAVDLPEEQEMAIPEKTTEELRADLDASAEEYATARGNARGSRGYLAKLLGLSKKGFSENIEEIEEVKEARSKYLQAKSAHLKAWTESTFKEYRDLLESKKGTASEEELRQIKESLAAKLEVMTNHHNAIEDLSLQDKFIDKTVEYYKTKGGVMGKVFGTYLDLYQNVYLKKVPPKVRAAISIAMMGGAVAGVAGAFGVAGGFAGAAALVSRPVRFALAPLFPAMTYTGMGKMMEKGQKWLRAKKAEKKTAIAGGVIEKMRSGEVSVEDTLKNLTELLEKQNGEYGDELVKRGWTEDRCEQARNILTMFVGARAAMVLMSGTEAITSFFEGKGNVAGVAGSAPKGTLYTKGPNGRIRITPQGMEAIEHSDAKPAQLSPQEQGHLQELAVSGSQVKTGGFVQEAMNRPAAGADYKPSEDVLYEHDAQGKITGLSSYGEQHFKGLNIEPHESAPGSYDQFKKPSVVPEHEIKTSDMRAPDAESQVAVLGNRELGLSKIQRGGGIERSAQNIIRANPKAFHLNPDDPKLNTKIGQKAHELAEGLAKKLGFEGKKGFQKFNEIVSHHVQSGDEIRVYQDSATGKMNLTYNGRAFGNGVFTGDIHHGVSDVSHGSAAQEVVSSKPKIAVENTRPKTGVAQHHSSRGAGKKPDWLKPYDQEIARSKKNFDFYNVESQKAHDALRASQEMSLKDSAKLSRITDLIHNRGSFARIFGVEHMDWDKPASDFISGHKGVVSQLPENQTWEDLQKIKFRDAMAKELERRLGPARGVTLQNWLARISNEQFRLIEKSVRARINYR